MKILVINPVGHSKWDEQDRKLFNSFASVDTEVDVISLPRGPPSVENPKSYAEIIPLIVEKALELHTKYDAIIINCFLDPAVSILRGLLKKPVIGPCESSLAIASILSKKIGIVTVSNEATWMIENRVRELGYADYIVSIRDIGLSVLQIDEDIAKTKEVLVKTSKEVVDTGAEVIILGCTGLGGFANTVSKAIGVPVIDPVGAAIKMAETFVKLNLYNPRIRG